MTLNSTKIGLMSFNTYEAKYEGPWYYPTADIKIYTDEFDIKAKKENKICFNWKDETILFCQNTSIRGIPHIFKARTKYIRNMWIFFVSVLIIGWCISMIFLIRQYLEFNVIHPPQVIRDANSPFPSVTVCNLRPISPNGHRIILENQFKTPRSYAQDSNQYGIKYLINMKNLKDYITYTGTINFPAYLESLPPSFELKSLGYNLSSFVIKCQMSYLKGSQTTAVHCHNGRSSGTWRSFIHAQYLNCYTFDISPKLQNNVTTLEMFLYLDENINSTTCIDCFHAEIKSQLSGAVIAVHSPGTFPDLNGRSINVSPGSLTEITLQSILNIQKAPPYGRCSLMTPKFISVYGYNVSYSEFICRQMTIQNEIIQKCGCIAIEYPFVSTDFPFCSSMPIFIPQGSCENSSTANSTCIAQMKIALNRIKCKISVINRFNKDIVDSCSLPCSFHSYETDRSVSTWPTKLWQIEWLKSKVAVSFDLLNRREFEPYKRVIKLQDSGQNKDAMDLLYQTNVLERNLLAILINRSNFNLHKVEEKEVLSLTNFLSQAGGLFSIWLGLTMISLVEVLELFLNCCRGRPANESHSQQIDRINLSQSFCTENF